MPSRLAQLIQCLVEQRAAVRAVRARGRAADRLWLSDWVGEEVLIRLEARSHALEAHETAAAAAAG